jgi:hypothetical protein
MSITFDTERWSSPGRAWDVNQVHTRQKSPRLVSIGSLPFFKARTDIEGDALFRQFTGETESTARIIKRLGEGETKSED